MANWWQTSSVKDGLSSQKGKCKWLKELDTNSSYFHVCVNSRRRRNQILKISINGIWYEENGEIGNGISNHFKNLFHYDQSCLPNIDGVDFQRISTRQLESISGVFTVEEIKKAVWSRTINKNPGPDGFNFMFF
ncbi:hypothetical protein Lal_00029564 [Lupinus albus]|nr:hypothetical protein Lal_00029564 [Lupinus albus]